MSEIRPYSIHVEDGAIDNLKQRLRLSRLPEKETAEDWSQGVPLSYMENIADYWLNAYDFNRLEDRLNEYQNFITEIDGLEFSRPSATLATCWLPALDISFPNNVERRNTALVAIIIRFFFFMVVIPFSLL